jgi:hypothetical protein
MTSKYIKPRMILPYSLETPSGSCSHDASAGHQENERGARLRFKWIYIRPNILLKKSFTSSSLPNSLLYYLRSHRSVNLPYPSCRTYSNYSSRSSFELRNVLHLCSSYRPCDRCLCSTFYHDSCSRAGSLRLGRPRMQLRWIGVLFR